MPPCQLLDRQLNMESSRRHNRLRQWILQTEADIDEMEKEDDHEEDVFGARPYICEPKSKETQAHFDMSYEYIIIHS